MKSMMGVAAKVCVAAAAVMLMAMGPTPVPLGASAPCGAAPPRWYEAGWEVGDGTVTVESGDGKEAAVTIGGPVPANSATLYTKRHDLHVSEGWYRVTVHVVSRATAPFTGGEVFLLHGGVPISGSMVYQVPHYEQGGVRSFTFDKAVHSSVVNDTRFGVGVRLFAANKTYRAAGVDLVSVAVERLGE